MINRAGMGPFTEPLSLNVDPSLLFHPVLYPNGPADLVTEETWFVSLIGILSILFIFALFGFVYIRRKQAKDKDFGHYNGNNS